MQEPKFTTTATNPFTELAELRLEFCSHDEEFDVQCRLIFGKMHYDHNDREYEIGLRRAHLRLRLEGCETTLEPAFGESDLPSVQEKEALETVAELGVDIASTLDATGTSDAKASAKVGAGAHRQRSSNQSRERLPMTRKPGDSWEIAAQTVAGSANTDLDGTAMSGQKLCSIRRKQGGNRISAVGEIQASKSAISVSARGGNKIGKTLTEWQNKDAIVSQILKRALQRETLGGAARTSAKVVVISKAEVAEE